MTMVRSAQLVRVQRGIVFRVSAVPIEDQLGEKDGDEWDVGLMHQVVYRKEQEARLEARYTVASMSKGTSNATIKRRDDAFAELGAFHASDDWFIF